MSVARGEPKRTVRCAIYTRKSSEDGLELDFNSLDAQREAGESYVASQRGASQKGDSWQAVPTRYDDGGFSGGTMDGAPRVLSPTHRELPGSPTPHESTDVGVYKS